MILNDVYEALTILYVSLPNSVTTYYNELVLIQLTLELLHVGLAGYHLLVVAQLVVLLVLEVAE
jgi:hypothetical protein